ncbi:MAG: gliding motility-associated C-terminal domain-containing protein [Cyclobacteriaceae bacterium]|nr:gliding motility-associated C-terminal domain-containing protein [Cyclobacteriaceae bacterium]
MKPIFVILLFVWALTGYGQNLHNHATIYIGASGVLYVSGDLTNNGLIVNNGDMQVGGAWTNNNQYDAGTGKITFNSNLPQIVNHNDQSFSRLTISGGGQKFFLANITIEDELVLNSGTLVSQNDAILFFSDGVTISDASDQSHIVGPVQHSGSGNKLFPIGNGSVYLPVQVNSIPSNAEVRVSTTELNGSTTLLKSNSLKNISDQRYFTLNVISGSLGDATLTLPVKNENSLSDMQSLVVAQALALHDPFASLGKSSVSGSLSDGSVTSELPLTGILFAIASADLSGIMVFNAVAPNGHEPNRYMRIANLPAPNKVSVYNRWGDKVYEIENYDDTISGKRFEGIATNGNELPPGNYFYKIEIGNSSPITGFLSLRR